MSLSRAPAASSDRHSAQFWPLLLAFFGVLLPLGLFSALAEDVWEKESFRFDNPILRWLHAHASPGTDAIMVLITNCGGVRGMVPLFLLVCAVLAAVRQREQVSFLVLCVGGASLLNLSAKMLFARQRPDLWHTIITETDYSFPSGHAMLSMATIAALLFLLWNARIPRGLQITATVFGALFVALVGLSRLYLGVHFPSDILGGGSASLLWVCAVYLVMKWHFRRRDERR